MRYLGRDDVLEFWGRVEYAVHMRPKKMEQGLDSKSLSFWVAVLVARAQMRNHGQSYKLDLELVMFGCIMFLVWF